ncbi:hypothetical protein [Paraburkholderia lycopersici]|uniref:Uncharacterized protein n=1 Tax=Paraburkholderia lycopersici TaxID=416944 RepID=A0A1G6Z2B6_9BURK|nr:hypothetical protein [Paraburkholderia lycopersici]SDD96681.1 hypothetical protein SAMN05421548_12954 [Paraburkholderia lycopersici]
MFSGLSKLADKSFILGFFLPALVGVLAFVALNRDVGPFAKLFQGSMQDRTFANLTVMLLVVWTLSVLLMAGSHWMYRVLEGYAWPLNRPGFRAQQLKRRKQQREDVRSAYAAVAQAESLMDASGSVATLADRQRVLAERKQDFRLRTRALALEYPAKRELVLPTRFGNALRAFEMYAGDVYGVESIHAWPRLLAVVPKDYQATLADARAPVDFFVSLVFVAFTLGVAGLIRGGAAILHEPVGAAPAWLFFCLAAAAFVAVRLAYLAAIPSAIAWGEVVKSAFDLYLPALARAMGYELPKTAAERRLFWEAQANQFQFLEPVRPEVWAAANSSPGAEGASERGVAGEHDAGATSDEAGEPDDEADESDDDAAGDGDDRVATGETRTGASGEGTVRTDEASARG